MKPCPYNSVLTGIRLQGAESHNIGAARFVYITSRTQAGYSYRLNPTTASFLQEAFKMAAHGKSVRQVATWLAEQGVKGSRGTPVSAATVQRLLTEPFCAGFVQDQAGRLTPGLHEALVDMKTFAMAQRRLMEKRCRPAKTNETLQLVG